MSSARPLSGEKRQRDEGIDQFAKTIPCPHGCQNIRFSTPYWRDQHVKRFHFHLFEANQAGVKVRGVKV